MKRGYDDDNDDETSLSKWEFLRIREILAQLNIQDISWVEALAKVSNGALLAKILYKLEKPDLLLMCRASKSIHNVCRRYQMIERFYTDSVFMFGNGKYGKLGDGDTSDHSVGIPKQIQNIPKVATISCGYAHTGIVTVGGDVYMFGNGFHGTLGDGDTSDHSVGVPRRIEGIPKVTAVSCGQDLIGNFTGIVTVDGDVYMFGNGVDGRLGDGDTSDHSVGVPRHIQDIPKVATISCGYAYTGIVTVGGDVYMFGDGSYGILGDGDTSDHSVGIPKQIQDIPKVATISCGGNHAGIVTVDGDVYMFGNGQFGKLGNGDTRSYDVGIPKQIQNIPKVAALSCGSFHTGIVTVDGDVYMFGSGLNGILGDGDYWFHKVGVPRQIQDIPKVAAVSCGEYHTGILTVKGDVYMFGDGEYGRLGDDDTRMKHFVGIPRQIQDIPKVAAISCGSFHTGIVTIPESSLNLTISCQMCGVPDAQYYSVHREQPAVFCSKQCQMNFYFV